MHSRLRRGLWSVVLTVLATATCLAAAPAASAAASPPPVFNRAYFFAASCVTSDDCWAVGQETGTGGVGLGLFVHWDGTTWSAIPGQSSGTSFVVHAVDCVATDDCWAVGWISNPGSVQPATEHWDGTAWTIATSPAQAGTLLQSVSCVATNDCWAVGQDEGSPDPSPSFVIHWNGTSWTKFSSPASALFTVDCVNSNFCLAGGNGANTLLVWNGTSWAADPSSVVTVQQPSAGITAIDCNSTTDCWVFAHDIRHYDGVSWTTSLTSDAWDADLGRDATPFLLDTASISCASPSDCWAVRLGDSQHLPASAHWDGVSWTTTLLPTQNLVNQIEGIDCSTGTCVAVGLSSSGSTDAQTFIAATGDLGMSEASFHFAARSALVVDPTWHLVPTPKLWSWIDLPANQTPVVTSNGDSVPGQTVTYTATLGAPAFRRGTVTFSDDGVPFRKVPIGLSQSAVSTTRVEKTAGEHVITATFTPLAPYLPVTSDGSQHVAKATTTTTLTALARPASTVYTARAVRVAPAKGNVTVGGAIAFYDGATLVALVPTGTGGTARVTFSGPPRPITATYLGSVNDLGS